MISFVLALGFALITFFHWERASLAAAESNISNTPQRYCHTSTTSRRLLVGTGFCVLVLFVIGLPAYLLVKVFWALPGAKALLDSVVWQWLIAAIAVALVAFAFRLPWLREARRQVRQIVLRHQFFPVLPTHYEQAIIQQLMVDAKRRRDNANTKGDSENIDRENRELNELCRSEMRRLENLYQRLGETLNGEGRLLKIIWLSPEWDLASSIYEALVEQRQQYPNHYSPALLQQIHLCEYYCLHLVARYIFATSFSREQSLSQFSKFGFQVRLESKPRTILI